MLNVLLEESAVCVDLPTALTESLKVIQGDQSVLYSKGTFRTCYITYIIWLYNMLCG